jgi:hypothetical protein
LQLIVKNRSSELEQSVVPDSGAIKVPAGKEIRIYIVKRRTPCGKFPADLE